MARPTAAEHVRSAELMMSEGEDPNSGEARILAHASARLSIPTGDAVCGSSAATMVNPSNSRIWSCPTIFKELNASLARTVVCWGILLLVCFSSIAATPADIDDPAVLSSKFEKEMTDKDVLDELVTTKYDNRVRPPSYGAILVNVSVLLLSLSSPDESSLKYEVEFLIHMFWMDTRLSHNETSGHQYLNGIHHQQHVWVPDIYFLKHGDFKHPPDPVHIALRIYSNGTVHYTARKHLILSCEGDGDIFPFDDPLCIFSIESISYEREDLVFKWVNDSDTQGTTLRTSKRLTTLNAYMVDNRTSECEEQLTWRGNYSCLMVELVFTRDKSFYLSTVFIPGIILVTSSFITFWLEWSAAPARVVIGVTTLLTFFTTSNGFRTSLPVVAKLGAMNVWDAVCMFFIYASLLEFVLVNYVGRKKPVGNAVYTPGENAVIQRIPAVIQRIGMTLVSPLQLSHRHKQSQAHADRRKVPEALPLNCVTCGATPCPHIVSPCDDVEENLSSTPGKTPLRTNNQESISDNNGGSSGSNRNGPPSGSGVASSAGVHFRLETEDGRRQNNPPLASSDDDDESHLRRRPLQQQNLQQDPPSSRAAADVGKPSTSALLQSPSPGVAKNGAESAQENKLPAPIHPIRIAKTIDVISRVLFPTAYIFFLIFFFARYAWFSYMWNER